MIHRFVRVRNNIKRKLQKSNKSLNAKVNGMGYYWDFQSQCRDSRQASRRFMSEIYFGPTDDYSRDCDTADSELVLYTDGQLRLSASRFHLLEAWKCQEVRRRGVIALSFSSVAPSSHIDSRCATIRNLGFNLRIPPGGYLSTSGRFAFLCKREYVKFCATCLDWSRRFGR